jgi:hypothetical protein
MNNMATHDNSDTNRRTNNGTVLFVMILTFLSMLGAYLVTVSAGMPERTVTLATVGAGIGMLILSGVVLTGKE